METRVTNYKAIDLAKFVFALLVVGIHTSPLKSFSEFANFVFVDIIAGMAVPFFFMASCYFFFSKLEFENGRIKKCKENSGRFKKYYVRILLLYVLWSGVYLLWQIPEWIHTGWMSVAAFVDYFKSFLVSSSYYHLWYVLSLLFVIPMMYCALRFIKRKTFAVIMAVVYILGIITYTFWSLPVFATVESIRAFMPTPFVSVFLIMPTVTTCLFADKMNISKSKSAVLFAVSFVLFAAESVVTYLYTDRVTNSQYGVFIIPAMYFLFVYLKSCNFNLSSKTACMLRNMSTVIYFIHPMVINIFGIWTEKSDINGILYYAIILSVSVVLSWLLSIVYTKSKRAGFLKYFM